jgi:hypothetical protein
MTAKTAASQKTETVEVNGQKSDSEVLADVLQKSIYASLVEKGDLSKLSTDEKTSYMRRLCEAVGLNPLTQPFLPLKLNGKEVFYATRNATDQLTNIHKLTRDIIRTETIEGVYIVTAKVSGADGRFEISTGAVTIAGLKGDSLANALMKAETKAKRRGTLSYCGLGFLDESEIDTIPRDRVEYPAANGGGDASRRPTKGQLVEEAKSVQTGEPMGVEHSRWRQRIDELMRAIGRGPAETLKFFDAANAPDRETAYRKVLRESIKSIIGSDNWPYTAEKTVEYLERFGITKIDESSVGQMEPLIEEMEKDGLIG